MPRPLEEPSARDRAGGGMSRLRDWVSQRNETALAAAVFAVLSVLFVLPALVPGRTLSSTDYLYTQTPWSAAAPAGFSEPGNTELYDPAFQFIPWLEYTRGELPGGDLLWNPHMAGGRPYLANMQSGVFSPFSLPAYLLPFWWSLGVIAAIKLFVAGFGAYLFGRRVGHSFSAGLLAGVTFGFGLYVVVHLMYPIGSVYVLIPWLLIAAHDLSRRPGPRSMLALAVLVALALLAGHPESSFHAVGFAVAYLLLRLAVDGHGAAHARRVAGRLVGAGLAGAALAAVVLVPFTELLALSSDYGNRQGVDIELPDEWILGAFMPEYFGTPTDATGGSVDLGAAGLFIARALYAGALPLMLWLTALLPALRRRGRPGGPAKAIGERRFFGAVAILCLALSFGVPGLFDAVQLVPVLGHANNTRLIVVYLLAVAVLAGFGLDDLRERLPAARSAVLAVAAAVLAIPLVVILASLPSPGALVDGAGTALRLVDPSGEPDVLHGRALFWWLPLAGAAVALIAARAGGRLAPGAFAALALALVCVDLFRAGQGFNPDLSQDTASLPETPAIRYLQDRAPARFVGFERALSPNYAMRYGLFDARNYDFPIVDRYDVLWRRYVFPLPYQPGAPQWVLTLTAPSLRVLGLLGVSDILVPPDEEAYARRLKISRAELGLDQPGLERAYAAADGHIYRNHRALPRAFVVHAQRVVDGEEESLRAVGDPNGPDLSRVAVTESALPGLAREPSAARPPASSPARIVTYSPQRVVIETSARRPGLAVLSDVHYPGWSATVDGEERPIEQVDYVLRGVQVPAGRSRVELTYRPASARAGAWVSAAALFGLAGAGLVLLRRSRRRPA